METLIIASAVKVSLPNKGKCRDEVHVQELPRSAESAQPLGMGKVSHSKAELLSRWAGDKDGTKNFRLLNPSLFSKPLFFFIVFSFP